jgi:hypothetical protein
MKKNDINQYLPIVVVGALAFGISQMLKGSKPTKGGEPDQPQDVPKGATYEDKVKILQQALKVGVDGIAGEQTNGALENLYSKDGVSKTPKDSASKNYPNLNSVGYGVISSANVDKYIADLKNNAYPLYLFNKNRATSQDASSVESAYAKGGILKSKGIKTFRGAVKDQSRNVWITTGKNVTLNANQSFIFPEITSRNLVKIVDKTQTGNLVVRVATATETLWYLVSPSDVYVG